MLKSHVISAMRIALICIVCIILITGNSALCSDDSVRQVESANKTPIPAEYSKFSCQVYRTIQQFRQGNLAASLLRGCINSNDLRNDSIRVVFELDHPAIEDDATSVTHFGGRVEVYAENLIQAWLPLGNIKDFNKITGVQYIRFPYRAHPTDVISEGLQVIGADICNATGYTGEGIKVAILDIGFEGYEVLLGTELPLNVTAVSFRSDHNIENNTVHGTACAEIIHDIVPDAHLYLLNSGTDVEFYSAVNYIVGEGVDVVNYSVGWFYGPMDGTSTIAQKVNWAKDQGVFWCTSAGNAADYHWWGSFYDPDSDDYLNFDQDDEYNGFYLSAGQTVTIYLNWEEWPTTYTDLDMSLWYGLTLVASAIDYQNGDDPPIEIINYTAPISGYYELGVKRYTGTGLVWVHIYAPEVSLDYQRESYSLLIPGDAEGSFTSGAVTYSAPSDIAYYSSQGPTWDGRQKPDLVAPSGVSTLAKYPDPFHGTSASSPHTAGVGAQMCQAYPTWSIDAIIDSLHNWAIDKGVAGPDNTFGWGLLQVNCPSNRPPSISGPSTVYTDEGENASFDVTATDPDGDDVIVTAIGLPSNSSFAKISATSWRFTFNPDYTQAGNYTVTFIASDDDLSDTLITQISVNDLNRSPSISGLETMVVDEGQSTSMDINTSDPDGDDVSVILANPPENSSLAQVSSSLWRFSFNSDYTQAGEYMLQFVASDGNAADTLEVTLTVINVNRAPTISGPVTENVNEGETLIVDLSVYDLDDDLLNVTIPSTPHNSALSKINSTTWRFTFTPAYNQAGNHSVNFIVTDGALSDTLLIAITVQDVNRPPVLATIEGLTGPEGSSISAEVVASDPDGDAITITAINVPENATFVDNGGGSASFEFQPDYTQSGTYTIPITVSDSDLSSQSDLIVTVTDVNRTPETFALISPAANAILGSKETDLIWEKTFDPDPGETVNYWVYLDEQGDGSGIDSNLIGEDTTYVVENLHEETEYHWRVLATDPHGGQTENSGGWRTNREQRRLEKIRHR